MYNNIKELMLKTWQVLESPEADEKQQLLFFFTNEFFTTRACHLQIARRVKESSSLNNVTF